MSELTAPQLAFVIGLEKLTRETGVILGGCGCCGSPWILEKLELPPEAGYATDTEGDPR